MEEMLSRSLGIYNFVWWTMACSALWLLYRIFQLVKAIHVIALARFKRDFPDVFRDG